MRICTKERLVSGVALLAVALTASACGYTLAGRGGSLPEHIRIIGIPQFTNRSTLPDIDKIVTERISDEFRNRGKYRVLPDTSGVDAILTGTVLSALPTPTSFTTGSRQASSYVMVVTLSVEFKDVKSDKVIWQNPSMTVREEYDVPTGAGSDPAAFFRQDSNALERLARNLAKILAAAIFEAM
ncbi:MAG TPA: LPS assembly lipoprotein LptE [Vicinamibacterales bacterium]|nr:LPS assembly lipoprotein LptE [Vicinamibacterales bacterium]